MLERQGILEAMRLGPAFSVFLTLSPAAMAETVSIANIPAPMTLELTDGRTLLLDGFMAPKSDAAAMTVGHSVLVARLSVMKIVPRLDMPDR